MFYKRLLLTVLIFISLNAFTQNSIKGSFPYLADKAIKLFGFKGFETYMIDSAVISKEGEFKLEYTIKDKGMGYLEAESNKPYFVVLSDKKIELEGEFLSVPETVQTLKGKENKLFVQYATEHPKREQVISAWDYLYEFYHEDSLFVSQKNTFKQINSELARIREEDESFLNNLHPKSYVSWFLPIRKLVSSVSTVAQYRTEEIPTVIADFRDLDYSSDKLYKSGFLKDVIQSHYWLLENMGQPLDSVYKEMNVSTDHLLESLATNEKKFNEITDYLFNLLERHSLYNASEYLAIKSLTQNSCTLSNELSNQLETYRKMKKGNIAEDFIFEGDIVIPKQSSKNSPNKLSDIQSEYTLVVFGASWCPKCTEEIPEIVKLYDKWSTKGVEVLFISLDESKENFERFVADFPFLSICDYKKWKSPIVKNYYVFATPTMYLLNDKQKILLRPNSIEQIDAWVEYKIQ